METKLSKTLQDANVYLEKYKIDKIVSEIVNKAVHSRSSNPIPHMIKVLASMTPQDILLEHNIHITRDD